MGEILSSPAPFPYLIGPTRDFPYKAKENGHCEKLIDNRCSVYDDRPLLCNVERLADETNMPMNKTTWYAMNYAGCNTLQLEIR
jgi:Fe-S-cluster containining protein